MVSDPLTDARVECAIFVRARHRILIVCPTCATSYKINAAKLGAGREVRCARCRGRWFATAAQPEAAQALTTVTIGSHGAPPDVEIYPPMVTEDAHPIEPEQHSEGALIEAPEGVPPLAPDGALAEADPGTTADVESAAARGARIARLPRSRRRKRGTALPLLILMLAAATAAVLGWRTHIVRVAPQSAGFYATIGLPVNLRGLAFENVITVDETHQGVPVLVVRGAIVNISSRMQEVPRLRLAVRNSAGLEIYAWTAQPDQKLLAAGENLPFRSRLASPPADARDVLVRFFHRRDLAGG